MTVEQCPTQEQNPAGIQKAVSMHTNNSCFVSPLVVHALIIIIIIIIIIIMYMLLPIYISLPLTTASFRKITPSLMNVYH